MNKYLKINLLALVALTLCVSACKKEYESIETVDDQAIQAYLSKNNLNLMQPDPDNTGFYYQVTNPADGTAFLNTDSVLYDITVKSLKDGNIYFQSPKNGNLGTYVGYLNAFYPTFISGPAKYNIPAIRTTVLGLKPGGTARVLLPSHLAFGKNGAGSIPSNENLDLIIKTYPFRKQPALDNFRIKNFLTTKSLTSEKDSSGIYYIVNTLGTGVAVGGLLSTVNVKYTGRFLDGTVFDSSSDGISNVLTNLIRGWQILLPKFRVGTKLRMFIPSNLAYGAGSIDPANGSYKIPPNAVLDFDIEIVNVTN
ncbi:MAG: FKBP-type peptidyl-prolyl cis-trans isomerase [Pedobacter sp.]|nr:FKBP-type peptidyl-prolyl cis-trans isomerase [Pedobacter sp.]